MSNKSTTQVSSTTQSGQQSAASNPSSSSNHQSSNSPASSSNNTFIPTSKSEILKSYGGRRGFQASYGLKFDPGSEDWMEGDAILEGLQKVADEDKLRRGGGGR